MIAIRSGQAVLARAALAGAGHGAGPRPEIGRRAARELARRELAKLAAEPLWARILIDIARLFGAGANTIPTGWFGLIALAVVILAVLVVILAWVRPSRRRHRRTEAVLTGKHRTARDYRREAERLAHTGDYSEAIIEGVRAIAAEIDERGILPPRLGRTADELAREAGSELPALAADLGAVTRLFDDIRYGDRPGTEQGYQLVSRVDTAVQITPVTLGTASQPTAAGPLGVPR
jgi:uncharacterized protein DUF4129